MMFSTRPTQPFKMERYGHLVSDGPMVRALYPGVSLEELEARCPWWTDTSPIVLNEIDGSLFERDESTTTVAKAEEQWARNLRDNVPGLAISPLPHMFMVKRPPPFSNSVHVSTDGRAVRGAEPDWAPLGKLSLEQVNDSGAWATIRVSVNDVFGMGEFGERWSYREVAERVASGYQPHPWDLPNPRLYWSSGTLAYMARNERFPVGPWLKALFRAGLMHIWTDARFTNHRADLIQQFLRYHEVRGNDPVRFREYLEKLLLDSTSGLEIGLVKVIGQYLVTREPETEKAMVKQERLLLHFYRKAGGDLSYDIDLDNYKEVAVRYGLDAKHFWREWRMVRASDGRSYRTSTPTSRTAARYIRRVLPLLRDLPTAEAMAREEMKDAEAEA